MKRLYLDTNIYLDFWDNRSDNLKPLGEFAFLLIKRAISCEFVIVYSDLVESELCKVLKISPQECHTRFFKHLDHAMKLERIENSLEVVREAQLLKKQKRIPQLDCNHAILALRAGARLVSRDVHLRSGFSALVPEEV